MTTKIYLAIQSLFLAVIEGHSHLEYFLGYFFESSAQLPFKNKSSAQAGKWN
jgi:hypothetical protein